MNLSDEQKKIIGQRLNDGDSIADIQRLITADFGVSMTFMETRFLLDDLNLELKKEEPAPEPLPEEESAKTSALDGDGENATGAIAVEIDKIVQPGAAISGTVSFSDGVKANWYVDPTGRLALDPEQEGYQPSAEDIEAFQTELQSKMQAPGL